MQIALNNTFEESENLKYKKIIHKIITSLNLIDEMNKIEECEKDIIKLIDENDDYEEEEIEFCITRENSSKSIYDYFKQIENENDNNNNNN